MARKVSVVLLSLLCLFLVGTAIVLSTTQAYLKIADWAYITEDEVPWNPTMSTANASRANEIVPRILHQTWKTDVLPKEWVGASQACRDMHPDYEYMLWTDAKSRQLIADHYPWFLSTFDGYKYKIQRADAIRYFVLHHFGGVYMDLDMGCLRPMDPLLQFQVILPKTIPVGVSNDLMTSTPGHPFMEQVTRGLITFDINYILNYPTVMFTTGPMFMSAQYGFYTAAHPPTPQNPGGEVRILPKSLYGKNAKPGEAPHSFFEHYYASSWHSDDAWLWTFLGVWGMRLMYVTCIVAAIFGVRMYIFKKKHGRGLRGRRLVLGRYEVVLPRFIYDRDTNATQLDVGPFSMLAGGHSREASGSSTALSPSSSEPTSPTATPRFPSSIMPFSVEVGPLSPSLSGISSSETNGVAGAIKRAGSWVFGAITPLSEYATSGSRRSNRSASRSSRRPRSRGILFFLPAIFHPSSASNRSPDFEPISLPPIDSDTEAQTFIRRSAGSLSRPRSPMSKAEEAELESVPLMGGKLAPPEVGSRRSSMAVAPSAASELPPPPYVSSRAVSPGAALTAAASTSIGPSGSWESWGERR